MLQMKKRVEHMIRHKYVPLSRSKPKVAVKEKGAGGSVNLNPEVDYSLPQCDPYPSSPWAVCGADASGPC